jgi:hypothetical protein
MIAVAASALTFLLAIALWGPSYTRERLHTCSLDDHTRHAMPSTTIHVTHTRACVYPLGCCTVFSQSLSEARCHLAAGMPKTAVEVGTQRLPIAVSIPTRLSTGVCPAAEGSQVIPKAQQRMCWLSQGITWLRAQGRNGSTGSGFPLDGTRLGGVPCAAGCEQHGNCNRDSGRCE